MVIFCAESSLNPTYRPFHVGQKSPMHLLVCNQSDARSERFINNDYRMFVFMITVIFGLTMVLALRRFLAQISLKCVTRHLRNSANWLWRVCVYKLGYYGPRDDHWLRFCFLLIPIMMRLPERRAGGVNNAAKTHSNGRVWFDGRLSRVTNPISAGHNWPEFACESSEANGDALLDRKPTLTGGV